MSNGPAASQVSGTLADASAQELGVLYRADEASAVEVVRAVLDRIRQCDKAVNAFVMVVEVGALAAGRSSDKRWVKCQPVGPLDGVPATMKDLFDVSGWPTRRGSLAYANASPVKDDTPCSARLREAGVVLIGKTTTSEFGWRGITVSPLTGTTLSPRNIACHAGGSSGGTAAAALGMGVVHVDSDALGSIRIPAAFCGVAGHKPTGSYVASWPSSPMGSLSHIRRIARKMAALHRRYDLLPTPLLPVLAFDACHEVPHGGADMRSWLDWDGNCLPFNVTGQPATTVSAGISVEGMLVCLQVVGPRHSDGKTLAFAQFVENVLPVTWPVAPRPGATKTEKSA